MRQTIEEQHRQIRAQTRQLEQMRNVLSERDLQVALWESGKDPVAWEASKAVEVDWWRKWLNTKGDAWPWEYEARLTPEQPLQDYVIRYLNAPPGATVSILDVGAGPLTTLGKIWEGRNVHITAVDPLAEAYRRLLDEVNITPPVRTQPGEVERLSELFPTEYFDLIHMQNALDHSLDPLLGIRQMLEVLKSGCFILLFHEVNEGVNHGYQGGFHHWNLCVEDGHFVIWNREARTSVNDALDNTVEITVEDSVEVRGFKNPLFVSIRKK
jgi:SAM-dependent methyltransferase